jgi:hypothetical protein
MATAARLDFSLWRNEPRDLVIRCVGLNLVGVGAAMQVRLGPDTPGVPLIELLGNGGPQVQGLYQISFEIIGGVPVSTIGVRLDTAAIQALPFAGEIGDATDFSYAIQFSGQTRIYGTMRVLATTFGADAAPVGRPPSYGGRTGGGGLWETAELGFMGEQITVTVDGLELVKPFAVAAEQSAVIATRQARDAMTASLASSAAALTAPGVSTTTAAGLASVAEGGTFWVSQGATLTLNRKVAGKAVKVTSFADLGVSHSMVNLSTYSPSDGKQFGFVAMAAGAAIITALAPAGYIPPVFDASDVGKEVRVAGAGADGADLFAAIASVQSATQATLTVAAATTIVQGNQKGAIIGTDCGSGLQAAVDAAKVLGGGVVVIDGVFFWRTPVTRNGGGSIELRCESSAAGLLVAGDRTKIMLTLANCDVKITANFAGCPGAITDCKRLLDLSSSSAEIIESGFFGISVRSAEGGGKAGTGGAIVWQTRGDMVHLRNYYGGCIGESGNGISTVDVDQFQSFTSEGNKFLDYGTFLGYLHSKTGIGFTLAWIRVRSPRDRTASVNHGSVVRMVDDRFDEGHYLAVMIQPDLDAAPIQQVHLSGLRINNSLLDGGVAITVVRAENVVIEQPSIGWANTPHNGIYLQDCGNVTIDSPYITAGFDGPTTGKADGLVGLNVRSLTLRNAGVLARRELTNVGRLIEIDGGVGGVLPFIKDGRVTDADFRTAPPIGTVAIDRYHKRLYAKFAEGWLASAVMTANDEPTELLFNATPATGTLISPTQYRKTSGGNERNCVAYLFKTLSGGFRMRVQLLDLVADAAFGATSATATNIDYLAMKCGLVTQPGGGIQLLNGSVESTNTTAAVNDIFELVFDKAAGTVTLKKNGTTTRTMAAAAVIKDSAGHHFGAPLYTQGTGFKLLEYVAL